MQLVVDRGQVGLADVLGRVDPEAGDAVADQLVEVGRQLVADGRGVGPQVGQPEQLAREDLLLAVEVVDAAAGRRAVTGELVEVASRVEAGVVVVRDVTPPYDVSPCPVMWLMTAST